MNARRPTGVLGGRGGAGWTSSRFVSAYEERRGAGGVWGFSLALVCASAALGFCGPTPGSLGAPPTRSADCPRLDSQLLQLSRSADPQRFAASAGLDLDPSGARVVIELIEG